MATLEISHILKNYNTIAVVGLSPKEERPSNRVARYLIDVGYHVIPVNPGQDEILGQKCYPDLDSVPEAVEIVDIFSVEFEWRAKQNHAAFINSIAA